MDPDRSKREQAYADMFRALGQVMHLIVDASVPEHVRNDSHAWEAVRNGLLGQAGNYEYWVLAEQRKAEDRFIANYLSTPITLDPALLQIPIPPDELMAQIPIARLFDSDRYSGTNPDVTVESTIGLAEIANANFLSLHTPFEPYPHPARANTEKYVGTYSKTGEKRSYYLKKGLRDPGGVGDPKGVGLRVDPVAAECVLEDATGFQSPTFYVCQDDDVWRATARLMLPRAVRYAQEVLDYFFRGKLDFQVQASVESPGQLELRVHNNSAETMTGAFTLYTEDTQGRRLPVPGAAIEGLTLAGASSPPGSPPLPGGPPPLPPPGGFLPTNHMITFTPTPGLTLGGLTLVFRGRLGAEEGAVVGKVTPWEPMLFLIQEFAELTGAEELTSWGWCVDPDTGELCFDGAQSAINTRAKAPGQQRAGGRLTTADGSEPGAFIKRIWVDGGTPAPTDPGVSLRINGTPQAGREWRREQGPAVAPSTWEVVVDLPHAADLPWWIAQPRLLVETLGGKQEAVALVWWRQNRATGEAWFSYCYGCCPAPRAVTVQLDTGTRTEVQVGFDNKFTPATGIGGYAVGTFSAGGGLPYDPETNCQPEASSPFQYAAIFVDHSATPTDRAVVSEGQSTRRWVAETDRSEYAFPPAPPPAAPPLVPTLRFRRAYAPSERLWYQQLGITPPEYEIELR